MISELVERLAHDPDLDLRKLERIILAAIIEQFRAVMREILEGIDNHLCDSRDKKRYENRGRNERELETVAGPIQYQRRYYRDKEQGVNVYLLDMRLGIRSYQRVSDGLVDTAGMLAVVSSSLRDARDRLADFASCQVLSHEGIRQLVLKLAQRIETEDNVCADEVRQTECLFIETDGLYVKM